MRRSLLWVAVVTLYGVQLRSAEAQSLYSDSAGVYFNADRIDVRVRMDRFATGGEIGYRLGNGLDVGLLYDVDGVADYYGGYRIGPSVAYTRPLLSGGLLLRGRAALQGTRNWMGRGQNGSSEDGLFERSGYDAEGAVSAHLPLTLARGLRVRPGVGVFHRHSFGSYTAEPGFFGESVPLDGRTTYWSSGAELSFPVILSLGSRYRLVVEPFGRQELSTGSRIKGSDATSGPNRSDLGLRIGINF